ncbi:MAG: hypothetical protein WC538_00445 [Thermoanaerobaculia bacterium]|jgi:hypothetical protein
MPDLVDFLLWRDREAHQASAVDLARGPRVSESVEERIVRAVNGTDSISFGTAATAGEIEVRVGPEVAEKHNLLVGSTGSGKTRFWLAIVMRKLKRALRRRVRMQGIRLCDPKGETAKLLMAYIALLWLASDDDVRQLICSAVHCVVAEGNRVTPIPPFAQIPGKSTAYVAELRAAAFDRASVISGQMRHTLFTCFWAMCELEAPFSYRFVVRLLRDGGYRGWVREHVQDQLLRELIDAIPSFARATIEAVLRVIVMFVSYGVVRASVAPPPRVLRQLGLPADPSIVIGDFSSSGSVPRSIALTRAKWFAADSLFEASVRDNSTHLNLAFEEVTALLAEVEELTDLLLNGYRTLRSRNVSVTSLLQSLEGLSKSVAHELLLNSGWAAFFASGGDAAQLLFPHVTPDPRDPRRESERARAFAKSVQELKTREYFLWVKTNGVLRMTAPLLEDPTPSVDELVETFHREVAPASTISVTQAEHYLAEWEREFVDQVRPGGAAPDFRAILFGGDQ